jgi:hypothetical protein
MFLKGKISILTMCFNSCLFGILREKKSDLDRPFNSCSLGILEGKKKIQIQIWAFKRPWF